MRLFLPFSYGKITIFDHPTPIFYGEFLGKFLADFLADFFWWILSVGFFFDKI